VPAPSEPMRNAAEPRFQRPEPVQRNYNREEPRPMPEPARPSFQQPQRTAPPQQQQQQQQQQPHNEARPAQKHVPHEKDDAQQH
ncbi:MAG TPA: hypothetical protein VGV14_08365, partial [Rhodanobacter sp.]|nr:hypothetical protein [Rhodanobacter sp.]